MSGGKLYLVGTPIGNLADFSPRGRETLEQVDFIAAEDTRVTVKLLNRFGIKKPMISYHEHNRTQCGQKICDRLLDGETCALVTDAGMPAISDPGEDLVRRCVELGLEVVAVPGPSAVVTALCLSGMPVSRFAFEGFLSVNKKSRKAHLSLIQNEERTLVFYEAPHKLLDTLTDLYQTLGEREIALAREMTKQHEEVIRTTLSQAIERYQQQAPRGEFVLVIRGREPVEEKRYTLAQAIEYGRERLAEGQSSAQAAKLAAQETGYAKSEIYKGLLE